MDDENSETLKRKLAQAESDRDQFHRKLIEWQTRDQAAHAAELEQVRKERDEAREKIRYVAEQERAKAAAMRKVIGIVMGSASPNEREHPSMFKAWELMRSALASSGGVKEEEMG